MATLFISSFLLRALYLVIYIVSSSVFSMQFYFLPNQISKWMLFLATYLLLSALTVSIARRGKIQYVSERGREFFLPSTHFRRRAFRIQTLLGFFIVLPVNTLVNGLFFETAALSVSFSALLLIWLLSMLSVVDFSLIVTQYKALTYE